MADTTVDREANTEELRTQMSELLEHMVENLVDDPQQVSIDVSGTSRTFMFQVRVRKGEMGYVIGKRGAMANHLREILGAVSKKHRVRSIIDFVE